MVLKEQLLSLMLDFIGECKNCSFLFCYARRSLKALGNRNLRWPKHCIINENIVESSLM